MNVLYLTVLVSVALVVLFVVGFVYHCLRASGDPLRDSLLPFQKDSMKAADSTNRPPGAAKAGPPIR